jgi:hypothetical protein
MSLGVLVGRFGEFLSELSPVEQADARPEEHFAGALMRVRERFNHHIIPLILLANSDGETVEPERVVILRYCLERAGDYAIAVTSEEEEALMSYLRSFRPTQAQLGAAVSRLKRESRRDILSLVAAAQALVDADRERRAREVDFLAKLSRDLASL